MMDFIEMPVQLIVKAPNQKVADQTVECDKEWTVGKLKKHLSTVYPSKPSENHQKIIYSGKLLQDHHILRDVLRQYEENQKTHTVHLVCAPGHEPRPVLSETTPATTSSVPTLVPSTNTPSTEGLRHRHLSHPQPDAQPETQAHPHVIPDANHQYFGHPAMPAGMMSYTPEQMMWMQQMYAQQMAHYMHLMQHGAYPGHHIDPAADTIPANQNEHEAPAANQPEARRRGGGQPNMVMNAQGGAVFDDEDEDGGNRDWLDWMYTLSRFMVLLAIIYFYSTFTRFVVVFTFFLVVYVYQAGWLHLFNGRNRRRNREPVQEDQEQRQRDREPAQPQEEREPEQRDRTEDQGSESEDSETTDATDGAEATNTEEPPEPRPGVIALAWSFFTTFFTSLVPEPPVPVNAN